MYIFGYGSLIWKQGFPFEEMIPGYVKGFKRRFWQGSRYARGNPDMPGRVVAVVESDDPEEKVYGVALRIDEDNEQSVRENLNQREANYSVERVMFHSLDESMVDRRIEIEIFTANENVDMYLGPAPLEDIAWQIYHSEGMCGHNMEYLMKLVWCNRRLFPDHIDEHLNDLEDEVNEIANRKGESLYQYEYEDEDLNLPITLPVYSSNSRII